MDEKLASRLGEAPGFWRSHSRDDEESRFL